MTYEQMYPSASPMESKIKLLLGIQGYKKRDIHFRDYLGKKKRYLRCAYWEQINKDSLSYVSEHTGKRFEEIAIYDDDCGWKFSYNIS